MHLWSINKWLRFTGLRLVVGINKFNLADAEFELLRSSLIEYIAWSRATSERRRMFADQTKIAIGLLSALLKDSPTRLSLKWIGLPGSAGWKRWER